MAMPKKFKKKTEHLINKIYGSDDEPKESRYEPVNERL